MASSNSALTNPQYWALQEVCKHYNRIAYTNKHSPPKEVWREKWHQFDGKRIKNDKKEGPVDGITIKVLFFVICA
nr:hypothetical protein [Tanacetum cinerariifolium]